VWIDVVPVQLAAPRTLSVGRTQCGHELMIS
jgi:hypothetical protein